MTTMHDSTRSSSLRNDSTHGPTRGSTHGSSTCTGLANDLYSLTIIFVSMEADLVADITIVVNLWPLTLFLAFMEADVILHFGPMGGGGGGKQVFEQTLNILVLWEWNLYKLPKAS